MSARTTAEWLDVLSGYLPTAPICDVAQAFANPFVETVEMVRTVPHPAKADFRMLANPLKIDGRRLEQRVCSPLGGDNTAVLGTLREADPRRATETDAH